MSQLYHPDLLAPFLALPQGDKIQAECMYRIASVNCGVTSSSMLFFIDVWIDGDGGLRSKTTVSRTGSIHTCATH